LVDASIRRSWKWNNEKAADQTSSVIGFVAMPATQISLSIGAAANDGVIGEAPVDVLLMTQATILAADLNQLVKFVFVRERPFVHYLPRATGGVRALTDSPSDDNLSFYSGHTSLAFAIAASSGTISVMRGYRLAPLVLGVGLLSAASVGYLRIAADKHYFSDVMVGAVVGSAVGALVPLIFHRASGNVVDPTTSSGSGLTQQPLVPFAPIGSTPLMIDGVW
jgi:membrane-associated phospholipid phosphatase